MDSSPWTPTSEADILKAAEDGILDENTVRCEFKQQVPTNKKMAEELASLALDGGSLLLGVVDPKHRTPGNASSALNPLDLEGLAEKVENIAGMCDPPISVFPMTIPSSEADGQGYLWIDVPQSPLAPHMVGGRYWGRNGGSKQVLTDPQVRMLIQRQRDRAQIAGPELDRFVERHPPGRFTPSDEQTNGSIHIAAVPLTGRDEMAQELFEHTDPLHLINKLRSEIPQDVVRISSFEEPRYSSRIADGYALSPYQLSSGQPEYRPNMFHVLEISEDGVVRFHHHHVSAHGRGDWGGEAKFVYPNVTFGSTYVTLALIGHLATALAYTGSWSIAVIVSELEGAIAYRKGRDTFNATRYSEGTYHRSAIASSFELQRAPGPVVNRLMGRLSRAIGADGWGDLSEVMLSDE